MHAIAIKLGLSFLIAALAFACYSLLEWQASGFVQYDQKRNKYFIIAYLICASLAMAILYLWT
jgi:hypothetical protein